MGLGQLLRRIFSGSAVPAQGLPERQPASRAQRPQAAAVSVPEPAAVIGARRPLVDGHGAIVGYAFSLGPAMLQRLQTRGEVSLVRAHLNGLFAAMRLAAQRQLFAYTELPAAWLALVTAEEATALHLGLRGAVDDAPALVSAVAAWRDAGARIGWVERSAQARPAAFRPDFVVCAGAPIEQGETWVAPELPDVDALEAALRAGARWAGCDLGQGATGPLRALPPQTGHLMQLLGRLVRDEDTAALVLEIKRDAALSVRLLQYLNSPGVSRGHTLDSIEQAVAVLGRDALYHWASSLLVRMGPQRPATAALQAQALARARVLEGLGRASGEASPGSLYLMGLGSMLPRLLQTSLDEALATLQLPPQAEQALRQREGPWAGHLHLVEALEAADLDTAAHLAAPYGGIGPVMSLSARAWSVAD